MMLFGIILGVIVFALIVNFLRVSNKMNVKAGSILNDVKSDIFSGLISFKNINLKDKNLFNIARPFFYSFSLVLFVIMASSGFLFPLFWQQMDGVILFIHVLIAPFFVISITLSVALFANKLQFNSEDYEYLTGEGKSAGYKIEYWGKIYFWLFVVAVILNLASIVLAMYPVFGTPGQNWLLNIHRYSALALLVFTLNYITLKYTFKK